MMDALAVAAPQRMRGKGRLKAKWLDGRSRLDVFFQEGAAKIRLPDTFDGAMEAVLINTSGGLTGGDKISWELEAGDNTELVVTTQACERIYRSAGGVADIDVSLRAGAGARLFWLPQETMLFDNGALDRRLDVELAGDSEFVAVESVLLGRTAMGETVDWGSLKDRWRIRRGGRLIHAEELAIAGPVATIGQEGAVLAGAAAFATILYCGSKAEALLGGIRTLLGEGQAGASAWQGKLVVRIAAADGFQMRKMLIPVISHLRDGRSLPKVWSL